VKKSRMCRCGCWNRCRFWCARLVQLVARCVSGSVRSLPPNTNLDGPVDVSASADTWAYARSPQFALSTSVSPVTVTPGSKVTYAYQVKNLTTDTAFTNVVVS
jgi:hypothetical protein